MYDSQMGNGFEQQLAQRMAQARRKPTRPGFNDPYRGRPVQGDVQHQFLNRPAPPPPDLPGGAPAWQQGDMGPSSQGSGFSMNREGIFADIMDIDNRDGGRRAALKNIYEFMRTYGPSLTPAQRSLVQQKARQIRNAFYAQRGQGGMGRMHATTQVPFDPSGYNPTPR